MDRNEAARIAFQKKLKPPEIRAIAVAIPSHDEVKANFMMAVAAASYFAGANHLPVCFLNQKGSLVHDGRNNLVAQAQQFKCEWLWFVDSDMSFPAETLVRLMSHKKQIVGCTYARRTLPHDNLCVPLDRKPVNVGGGLIQVDRLPTGCVLIHLDVFKNMKRPYFRFEAVEEDIEKGIGPSTGAEDYYFFDQCRKQGFEVWLDVDLSWNVTHWGEAGFKLCERDATGKTWAQVELPCSMPNQPKAADGAVLPTSTL